MSPTVRYGVNGIPTSAPRTFAPRRTFALPDICPPRHLPPPRYLTSLQKNNKQRLRFNNITSIVIKSIYKDAKDEMQYALINSI